MLRLRHKLLIHAFRLFDQALMYGVLIIVVAVMREHGSFGYLSRLASEHLHVHDFLAVGALVGAWLAIFGVVVRYDANRLSSVVGQIWDFLKAAAFCTLVLLFAAEGFKISHLRGGVILHFWLVVSVLGVVSRLVLRWLLMILRQSGRNSRHLLIVGTSVRATNMARLIESKPELGYRLEGFIAEDEEAASEFLSETEGWQIIGQLDQIQLFLEQGAVDEVMVCLPVRQRFNQICDIVQLCRDLGVVARLVPDLMEARLLDRLQIERCEGDCVVTFFRESHVGQLLFKRMLDVGVSATMLVMLSPLLLVTALLVKLTSPGPVFFRQARVGMNKRRFKLLKFRSMVADAEQRQHEVAALNEVDGPVFKIRNDPRLTPFGRFIRKTSIDELPQLINVIKGDMSLVGPRPPLPSEVKQYEWLHRKRLSIKPGITCLWQVSGRNSLPFAKWMELDREYIENWSIWLDLKILFRTIPAVLSARGAA